MPTTDPLQFDSSAMSARWLGKTCGLLAKNEWPSNRPLSFDGSGFSNTYQDEANFAFLSSVLRHGKCEVLHLRRTFLDSKSIDILEDIMSYNQNLKCIILTQISCHDETTNGLPNVFSNTNVEEVVIEKCRITSQVARALGSLAQHGFLKSLKFTNVEIDEDCNEMFNRLATGSLSHLAFRKCGIHDSNLSLLFQYLSADTTLQSLNLDSCRLGSEHVKEMAAFLKNNHNVRDFCLCGNNLDGECIQTLVEDGLLHNHTLSKLKLSHNPIGDDGARHIASLLCANPCIEFLSLVDCEIWSPGCIVLAQGLAQMKGLKQLYVDDEWELHIDYVLESMASNMTLVNLMTSRTPYLTTQDPKWEKLDFFLRLNRGKRRILTEGNIPVALWAPVLAGLGKDACLVYHMLRHKPDLF